MARLLIIYSPDGRLDPAAPEFVEGLRLKQAMLDIPGDLANRDIYEIARRLAELLLEQL